MRVESPQRHVYTDTMTKDRRAQVLLEPGEYDALERIAKQHGVSVAELFRRAVKDRYLSTTDSKRQAFAKIAQMKLPIEDDWTDLSNEIEEAHDVDIS